MQSYVEELSRSQVGSVIIILEIVYYVVSIAYYVWRWVQGRRVKERRVRKEWRHYYRRRVVQATVAAACRAALYSPLLI